MNLIRILDLDGNLMYEGKAKSRKALVQQLVQTGKSMERANLEGADLTHLNLDGCIFDGANLTGTDMRGTRAKHGSFVGAKLDGIVGMGLMAKHANFKGASFQSYVHPRQGEVPSRLDGAILQNCNFDDVTFGETNLTWAGMSNSTFVNATVKSCNFFNAHLHNIEWGRATIEKCMFDGAKMEPTFDKINGNHIPDRTIDARVIGNSYKKAEIGKGNAAFRKDSVWNGGLKFGYGAAATLALAGAGAYLPMDIDFGAVKDFVGNASWGFIGVASALILTKDRIEDFFKDGFAMFANNTTSRVRAVLQDMAGRGVALKNVSVAVTAGRGGPALREALRQDNSKFKTVKANLAGTIDVIVADRKHLAAALHRISDTFNGNRPRNQDVVITRIGRNIADTRYPASMIFGRDGSIEAVWNHGNGEMSRKKWDIAGVPITAPGELIAQGPHNEHAHVMKRFVDMILLDNDVMNFDFQPSTHAINQGLDGSIVVTSRNTGKLDNPFGPAILTPNDEAIYFINGSKRDQNFKRIRDEAPESPPGP